MCITSSLLKLIIEYTRLAIIMISHPLFLLLFKASRMHPRWWLSLLYNADQGWASFRSARPYLQHANNGVQITRNRRYTKQWYYCIPLARHSRRLQLWQLRLPWSPQPRRSPELYTVIHVSSSPIKYCAPGYWWLLVEANERTTKSVDMESQSFVDIFV